MPNKSEQPVGPGDGWRPVDPSPIGPGSTERPICKQRVGLPQERIIETMPSQPEEQPPTASGPDQTKSGE